MEISGFFGNSVVSHDVFLEAVLWEDVLLKLTHERMFCWIRQTKEHMMLCWSGCLRGRVMLRKSINITPWIWEVALALLCHAMLLWPHFSGLRRSSLHREKHIKELLMVFWLILAISLDSCKFCGALQLLLKRASATDSCSVFVSELTADILTTKMGTTSK